VLPVVSHDGDRSGSEKRKFSNVIRISSRYARMSRWKMIPLLTLLIAFALLAAV